MQLASMTVKFSERVHIKLILYLVIVCLLLFLFIESEVRGQVSK